MWKVKIASFHLAIRNLARRDVSHNIQTFEVYILKEQTIMSLKYILIIDHIATGGAERILVDYYHYLINKGHKVIVFCLTGQKGTSPLEEGLNVVYGAKGDEDNLLKKTWQQFSVYQKLRKVVAEFKPDVMFSFLEKSNLLTSFVSTNATKVLTVHNVLSIQYTKIQSDKVRRVLYSMIRWMYNRCPNVVSVSQQVKDDLISSFGINGKNIHLINNYVDRADIKRKSEESVDNFQFKDDVKYIMNIGRFSDQKAQWKLLKAFSLYLKEAKENVCLVLMGNGDYTEKLKQLASDLGISDKTVFLPFNPNPYKYMAHAHLFVLSSIFEGFPIVLAEVSSLRIPFVGTRKAIPEEMFDDKTIWEQCIFDSTTLKADFSIEIHDDECMLAKLIRKGIEENDFRESILKHTQGWEKNNDKSIQFEEYDKFK